MANNKSMEQFYQDFREEILMSSDMDTNGWTTEDFLTNILLEYMEEAGEVTDPIMCPFRSHGLQLNAYAIAEDYSSLDIFVSIYSDNDNPRSVSQTEIDAAIKRGIQLYQKAINDLYTSFLELALCLLLHWYHWGCIRRTLVTLYPRSDAP